MYFHKLYVQHTEKPFPSSDIHKYCNTMPTTRKRSYECYKPVLTQLAFLTTTKIKSTSCGQYVRLILTVRIEPRDAVKITKEQGSLLVCRMSDRCQWDAAISEICWDHERIALIFYVMRLFTNKKWIWHHTKKTANIVIVKDLLCLLLFSLRQYINFSKIYLTKI